MSGENVRGPEGKCRGDVQGEIFGSPYTYGVHCCRSRRSFTSFSFFLSFFLSPSKFHRCGFHAVLVMSSDDDDDDVTR